MEPIVELVNVRKTFGHLEVLNNVNLAIQRGLVTAMVGHNGSGKTTLIKSILGLVRPDTGTVSFDGRIVGGESGYRDRIGYMAQAVQYPDNLAAADLFDVLTAIRGRTPVDLEHLVERFKLSQELAKPLRTLSGGTRQKVSAVIAFMFRPEMLVLDEPTAGLDPIASSVLKDLIVDERQRGRSFVLTSHVLSDIEELADVVVFLQDGRIRYEGDIASMRSATGEINLERAIARLMLEEAA